MPSGQKQNVCKPATDSYCQGCFIMKLTKFWISFCFSVKTPLSAVEYSQSSSLKVWSSMPDSNNSQPHNKDEFLFPRSKYYGKFTPKHLTFNANLQEFAQRVTYICCLETGGKVTPEEAYEQIKHAWKQLKKSKKGLGIGEEAPPDNQE
jgi:hypothetical protein